MVRKKEEIQLLEKIDGVEKTMEKAETVLALKKINPESFA